MFDYGIRCDGECQGVVPALGIEPSSEAYKAPASPLMLCGQWCSYQESNSVLRITKPLHHHLCFRSIIIIYASGAYWQKGGDSNPCGVSAHSLSKRDRLTAPAPFYSHRFLVEPFDSPSTSHDAAPSLPLRCPLRGGLVPLSWSGVPTSRGGKGGIRTLVPNQGRTP